MQVPTVKIFNKDGSGYVVINEGDFNPESMQKWGEERVVVADQEFREISDPLVVKELSRCKAHKGDGTQCSRDAIEGSDYCGIQAHQKQGE